MYRNTALSGIAQRLHEATVTAFEREREREGKRVKLYLACMSSIFRLVNSAVIPSKEHA
jgi:hypothetical protein